MTGADVKPEVKVYGPVARRKCRDVIFLILFIVFWVGMALIGWKAVLFGNPQRLQYGTDMYGAQCGFNNKDRTDLPVVWRFDLSDKPYLYFPTPLDISVNFCVDECPTHSQLSNSSGYICDYGVNSSYAEVALGNCFPAYKSQPILNRCIPTISINNSKSIVTQRINSEQTSIQVLSDVVAAYKWIISSAALAVFLGIVWLVLMRFFSGFIVWFTIVCVYIAFFGITAFIWWQGRIRTDAVNATPADERLDNDVRDAKALRISGYILVGFDAIMLILLIWMRRRIALAIGIIKQATKAIAAMPSLIAFPAFTFILMAIFAGYWIAIAVFIGTSGKAIVSSVESQVSNSTIRNTTIVHKFEGFDTNNVIRGLQIYHFFGYLWTMEFIAAFSQVTIAMAVASWYWAKDKSKDVPTFPVISAVGRTLRYHLGSIAFGSLIVAIVRFIRAMIAWLQKRLKAYNNRVFTFLLRALDCLFACFERFLKFINKNAYIMIAIKGDSFCASARGAFVLLLANILRVGVVGVISNFLLFLGKIFITIGATLLAAYLCSRDSNLHFWIIPCIMAAIINYFIASCFMLVYDMAIDTILLSFCEDEAQGEHSNEYYNEDLKTFIDGAHKKGSCCC